MIFFLYIYRTKMQVSIILQDYILSQICCTSCVCAQLTDVDKVIKHSGEYHFIF